MENFFLNFPIKAETTLPFLNSLENFEKSLEPSKFESILQVEAQPQPINNEPVARIYINSPGGEVAYATALYHFFKYSPYKYEFVILESCDSSAFFLMLALCPDNMYIYCGSAGMLHEVGFAVDSRDLMLDPTTYQKRRLAHLRKTNDIMAEIIKLIVTKEEYKIYKSGEDLYLDSDRLSEIFAKAKTSKTIKEKMKKFFEIN